MFFLLTPCRATRVVLAALLSISLLGTMAAGQRHRIVHGETERPDLHALHKAQHACAAFDYVSLAAGLPATPLRFAARGGPCTAVRGPCPATAPAATLVPFSARAPPAHGFPFRSGGFWPPFANKAFENPS